MYMDLHAHASKRGCFLYGNHFTDAREDALNQLYAHLIALNAPQVEPTACVFSARNMVARDKRDGLSKEGSGRVAVGKDTGIIHAYTLECNYNTGRSPLPSWPAPTQALALDQPPVPPQDSPHAGKKGRSLSPTPPLPSLSLGYTEADFARVGRGLLVAALDLVGKNEWSRLLVCPKRCFPRNLFTLGKTGQHSLVNRGVAITQRGAPQRILRECCKSAGASPRGSPKTGPRLPPPRSSRARQPSTVVKGTNSDNQTTGAFLMVQANKEHPQDVDGPHKIPEVHGSSKVKSKSHETVAAVTRMPLRKQGLRPTTERQMLQVAKVKVTTISVGAAQAR